tara:strand:+ start:536 stop:1405 length:870 start_codon:yes stop_codon:yes gene_type:complete
MNIDSNIIEQNYKPEFDFMTKLYLKEIFPHSWIFYGPKGSGKRKFLDIFIQKVLKEKKNEQFVHEINGDDNIAMIDDVRKLINQCNLTNSVDSIKKTFVLINNLELLNKNSIIALLKTIEEPPPNTVLVLIANNLKLIPKTIQSRCIKIKFNPYKLLIDKNEKESEIENILISDGHPNIYNLLVTEDGILIKDEIKKILELQSLEYIDFENFYLKISKDFDTFFPLIINIVFFTLKLNFKNHLCDLNKKLKILNFLDFLKNNFKKGLLLDNKRALFLMFNEYVSLQLSK